MNTHSDIQDDIHTLARQQASILRAQAIADFWLALQGRLLDVAARLPAWQARWRRTIPVRCGPGSAA